MRERGGRTLPFVVTTEDEAVLMVRKIVTAGSIVYADEPSAWDVLHASHDAKRFNHSLAFSDNRACTNQVESYFSHLRRAEIGQHHRMSGMWLPDYASEMAWREDRRRTPNATLCLLAAGAALGHPVSQD